MVLPYHFRPKLLICRNFTNNPIWQCLTDTCFKGLTLFYNTKLAFNTTLFLKKPSRRRFCTSFIFIPDFKGMYFTPPSNLFSHPQILLLIFLKLNLVSLKFLHVTSKVSFALKLDWLSLKFLQVTSKVSFTLKLNPSTLKINRKWTQKYFLPSKFSFALKISLITLKTCHNWPLKYFLPSKLSFTLKCI
jgi:hypothetical protein